MALNAIPKRGKVWLFFQPPKLTLKWWPSVIPPRSIEGAESCSPQRKSASSLLGPYPPWNFVPLKIGGWKMKVPWNGCVSLFSNGYLGGGNSNIFYVHPYLGKVSNLTHIFQMGWNHQLAMLVPWMVFVQPFFLYPQDAGCRMRCFFLKNRRPCLWQMWLLPPVTGINCVDMDGYGHPWSPMKSQKSPLILWNFCFEHFRVSGNVWWPVVNVDVMKTPGSCTTDSWYFRDDTTWV